MAWLFSTEEDQPAALKYCQWIAMRTLFCALSLYQSPSHWQMSLMSSTKIEKSGSPANTIYFGCHEIGHASSSMLKKPLHKGLLMSRTVPTVLAYDESNILSVSFMAWFPFGQTRVPACQRSSPYVLCISEWWQGSADIKHEEGHEGHVCKRLVTAGGRFALIHISGVCLQRMQSCGYVQEEKITLALCLCHLALSSTRPQCSDWPALR